MIDITTWMDGFLKALHKDFGDRVWFVGLQGSYGRGEATETSDIDLVVILDELSASDIQTYHDMLEALPHRDLICGFLPDSISVHDTGDICGPHFAWVLAESFKLFQLDGYNFTFGSTSLK